MLMAAENAFGFEIAFDLDDGVDLGLLPIPGAFENNPTGERLI
jgi:hypothetical protein